MAETAEPKTYTLRIPIPKPKHVGKGVLCWFSCRNDLATIEWAAAVRRVPPATGPRRVGLHITVQKGRSVPRPKNFIDGLLAVLVKTGLVLPGGEVGALCTFGGVQFAKGERDELTLTITDEADPAEAEPHA
jgi:hypothetical protein